MAVNNVLEKQLVLALDKRLAVFVAKAADGSLLRDEMLLRSVAYIVSDIVMPCCCSLCNKKKLEELLTKTYLCKDRSELAQRLAALVYDDLARCNGLG